MNWLMIYGFALTAGVCFGSWKESSLAGVTVYSTLMCLYYISQGIPK